MWSKFFSAIVLVRVTAVLALAQDPTKVEPQHYKLDFENERVQVVHVHYGPHEKSVTHEHPAGVVVNLTEGHLKFTDEHGKTQEVYAKPGEVRWFPSPHKHKVQNLSDAPYNAVYIGVKGKSTIASATPGSGSRANEQVGKVVIDAVLTSLK
jgi:quercetin dioxygenase-like cupin family protein